MKRGVNWKGITRKVARAAPKGFGSSNVCGGRAFVGSGIEYLPPRRRVVGSNPITSPSLENRWFPGGEPLLFAPKQGSSAELWTATLWTTSPSSATGVIWV